ncbi:transmembrane protein 65 [Chrysoperla carnea]|uniref:transmembrane protein 65 n=1 Tax=Chrysoperla carnea TaxID=189513 RepID=UPI001D07CD56|nr:transmembrane protein 65 [Chrysoperla carnea]
MRKVFTKIDKYKQNSLNINNNNLLWTSVYKQSASSAAVRHDSLQNLTKVQAQELALRLTNEERQLLLNALQEYQSKIIKDEYEGQLAASRWRSKFGRPSKLPTLGDVDPTGTFCPMPEDWLLRKYAEKVPKPSTKDLWSLAITNAIPFIGFGFLDNFVMLLAGDYIDYHLNSFLVISTMGAAALGNTFSDVLGIGSAYYVERAANKIGFKPPNLTPIQLDMRSSRWAANLGRVIGVTIGCFLGMIPLLFSSPKEVETTETTSMTSAVC